MLAGKSSGKPARQLLFSEAISQQRTMTALQVSTDSGSAEAPASLCQNNTMERLLQEITSVGCWLEGMDSKISDLAVESKSIQTDIAGFQDKVTEIDHLLVNVEGRLNTTPDRDQKLLYLRNKLTDV
ncbi:hypothetical protein NDU88_004777 [Pleurodeles waltl]|uniref:Uncharacterized protein n=1 Tax=Pleurodeles waltl TaxID=8319 RepID=A0AAV7LMC7_PLEWA|nr:hypothetical protein NDU88_004777 [Pleurodeles waltl]